MAAGCATAGPGTRSPRGVAEAHTRFASEFGLSIVGGCCGTTPEHIRQVVEALGGACPQARPRAQPVSLYQSVPLDQDTTYLTVGERCNANGSRRFRDLMLEATWTAWSASPRQIREAPCWTSASTTWAATAR